MVGEEKLGCSAESIVFHHLTLKYRNNVSWSGLCQANVNERDSTCTNDCTSGRLFQS